MTAEDGMTVTELTVVGMTVAEMTVVVYCVESERLTGTGPHDVSIG